MSSLNILLTLGTLLIVVSSIQFAHQTMKPNATRLYEIYQSWVNALQDVSDVEGLRPGFVLNLLPKTAATVAKTNGVGNAFGLEDDQPYMSMCNGTKPLC